MFAIILAIFGLLFLTVLSESMYNCAAFLQIR